MVLNIKHANLSFVHTSVFAFFPSRGVVFVPRVPRTQPDSPHTERVHHLLLQTGLLSSTLHMGKCDAATSHLLLTVSCCPLCRASSTVSGFCELILYICIPSRSHFHIFLPVLLLPVSSVIQTLCESRFDAHSCTVLVMLP